MKNLNHDERYVSYENVIYRLAGYGIYEHKDASYPHFKIQKIEESYYTSFEEAEKRIAELVENKERTYSHWHSFMIDQVPVGVNCPPDEYQIRRTYSFDGSFVMQSYASHVEDVNGTYETCWGRDKEDILFESGQIVEVHNGCNVTLEIVVSVPGEKGDGRTSDGYSTLCRYEDNYAMYHDATDCFPVETFPVEECLQKELFDIYEKYMNTWLKKEE